MSMQKRALNVRFDPGTRLALEEAAALAGVTISEVVVEATNWWLADPNRTCPVSGVADATGRGLFINVRYPEETLRRIAAVAASMGTEKAPVVRCAVRSWLLVPADVADPGVRVSQPALIAV